MIAETACRLATAIAGESINGATEYWRIRYWDRSQVEADPILGPAYVNERRLLESLIERRVPPGAVAIDMACGTGAFTAALLRQAGAVTAVDVSGLALERTRARVAHDSRVDYVEADFWDFAPGAPPQVVTCVDAIHHLGDISAVLARLSRLAPEALLIGNVWTADNFHQFSRARFGTVRHAAWTLGLAGAAVLARLTRRHQDLLRTSWLPSTQVEELLTDAMAVEYLHVSPYFVAFAGRLGNATQTDAD